MPDSVERSSGVIYGLPNYVYNSTRYQSGTCDGNGLGGNGRIVWALGEVVHASRNTQQLGTTGGSHIGYEWVTISESGNGKKELHYSTPAQYPDIIDEDFPFVPPSTQSYKTGLLLEEKDYSLSGSTYSLIQQKINQYDFVEASTIVPCVSFLASDGDSYLSHIGSISLYPSDSYSKYYDRIFKFQEYQLNTGYPRLKSIQEISYFPQRISKTIAKIYHPTQQQLLKEESTINSDNKVWKATYTYPIDEPGSPVISDMLNKNMMSFPITIKAYVDNSLKTTEKYTYSFFNGNHIALGKKESSTEQYPLESEVTYNKYDLKGNLLSYTLRGAKDVSILWGYGGTYPVAKIINIDATQLSSFLSLNPSIQSSFDNPSGDQVVRDAVQQIRAYFPKALVAGYTYKPLVGITSMTDANNIPVFYEYDLMGRLKAQKDRNSNILKQFNYTIQSAQ